MWAWGSGVDVLGSKDTSSASACADRRLVLVLSLPISLTPKAPIGVYNMPSRHRICRG